MSEELGQHPEQKTEGQQLFDAYMALSKEFYDQGRKKRQGKEQELAEIRSNAVDATITVANHFGILPSYLSRNTLAQEAVVVDDEKSPMLDSVTIHEFGPGSMTLEIDAVRKQEYLDDPDKGQTLPLNIAFRRQEDSHGVKVSFQTDLKINDEDFTGEIIEPHGEMLIEVYDHEREKLQIKVGEDGDVNEAYRFDYDGPSKKAGSIPKRERRRTFPYTAVGKSLGKEDSPESKKKAIEIDSPIFVDTSRFLKSFQHGSEDDYPKELIENF